MIRVKQTMCLLEYKADVAQRKNQVCFLSQMVVRLFWVLFRALTVMCPLSFLEIVILYSAFLLNP